MNTDTELKEKIISAATELIQSGDGNAEALTVRSIAEKAGVGTGLINYHFRSKENLIEMCVQRLIKGVISGFKPQADKSMSSIDNFKAVARYVADFLTANPSVSRISILGDLKHPKNDDNTMFSVKGFSSCLNGFNFSDKQKKYAAFALTTALQTMFLRKDRKNEYFGLDFNLKCDRDLMIDSLVDCFLRKELL